MDRWRQYLFEEHSEETLRSWARRLRFFRFFRALGGHAGDGDSLDVAYRHQSLEELESFLDRLGLTLVKHAKRPPQPEPGVSYPLDEYGKFPSLITGTEWYEQPGHCILAGEPAFVWCESRRVKISLHQGFCVTEANVASAEKLEILLSDTKLERIDPPLDTKNYICPKYYPDYFV